MRTLPAPPFKGMGKLIHIAAWAILFGLPFFFTGRESQTVTILSYIRSVLVPLSFMLVFYVNYFVLIDYFLFAKRPWKYFLCNVLLIAFAMGAVHLMFQLLPHPEWEHPRPEREWQEIVGFFMVNAMLYLLVAGVERRHQDDGKLVSDEIVSPGVGEKPCRSGIAKPEEPVEPAFSL